MPLLGEQEQRIVRERLATLTRDVEAVLFTDTSTIITPGKEPCVYCKETEQLLKELEALTDKLHLTIYNLALPEGKAKAQEMGVEAAPTIILREKGSDATNLRYRGIPAGYEFASLLEDIEMLGRDGHGLPDEVVQALNALPSPVRMQVFVTPTCPYCPAAVRVAHRFAYASPKVVGEMIEAQEFPKLSDRYGIHGVPDTVINEGAARVLGAQPVSAFLEAVQKAAVPAS
ncbi:protein disulfide oxidoreductase [Marinithermus hydrothermalis]|uniref:Glutaredoxin-like domain protein n=1 Tax=Marinithermus hydrothermalis (strain DSM 14884 / JCM 11576 / T1) TaxID=869210 RepID=F2NLI3_MARHT|nr:thioredoxin family protein [Marinithermus hydrothermalis]AEB12082.1 glutaredoxin-like domain protein [Marinithermus hydrothermalis DSM 14884]